MRQYKLDLAEEVTIQVDEEEKTIIFKAENGLIFKASKFTYF